MKAKSRGLALSCAAALLILCLAGPLFFPTRAAAQSLPFEWPVVDPGGSWNVPRIALPSCMGLLPQYEEEWWYYVGYAVDDTGEKFSLQVQILRASLYDQSLEAQVTGGFMGIGRGNSFYWGQGYSMGVSQSFDRPASLIVPPVTNAFFQAAFTPLVNLPEAPAGLIPGWRFSYVGGAALGALGSLYTLYAKGNAAVNTVDSADAGTMTYELTVEVVDRRGMVMEGSSGYVGPDQSQGLHGAASYEYAQPILDITSGTLAIGSATHRLVGGSLWLDRQVLTNDPYQPAAASSGDETDIKKSQDAVASKDADSFAEDLNENLSGVTRRTDNDSGSSLYIGTWIALVLDSGTSMVMASFWQKKAENQWMTGSLVGEPPASTFGNLYFPLVKGQANAGALLHGMEGQDYDFDVNILEPDARLNSPHWTSPISGQTYATAWWVRFGSRYPDVLPENVYLFALSPCTENRMPDVSNAFWEGAARVCSDPEGLNVIGHAFVEQMGFKNQEPEPEPEAAASYSKSGGQCFLGSLGEKKQ